MYGNAWSQARGRLALGPALTLALGPALGPALTLALGRLALGLTLGRLALGPALGLQSLHRVLHPTSTRNGRPHNFPHPTRNQLPNPPQDSPLTSPALRWTNSTSTEMYG